MSFSHTRPTKGIREVIRVVPWHFKTDTSLTESPFQRPLGFAKKEWFVDWSYRGLLEKPLCYLGNVCLIDLRTGFVPFCFIGIFINLHQQISPNVLTRFLRNTGGHDRSQMWVDLGVWFDVCVSWVYPCQTHLLEPCPQLFPPSQ